MSEEKCTQLSSQFCDAHFDSSIIVTSTYKGLQQEQWEVLCLMSRQKLSYTEHLRKDYFFIGHLALHLIPFNILINVYDSLVQPYFNYC